MLQVRGDLKSLGVWGVGPLPVAPHISYVGELHYADTGARAIGVAVEFRRTGGIAVEPDTLLQRTDASGRFALFLKPTPSQDGEVVGEVLVRPPPPYASITIPDVRLPTLRGGNDIRFLGVWTIPRAD